MSIYMKAHDYILKHGWTQEGFQSYKGEVCILGALGMASTEQDPYVFDIPYRHGSSYVPQRRFLARVVKQLWGYKRTPNLINWNDARGRTVEDVLRALKEADYIYREE